MDESGQGPANNPGETPPPGATPAPPPQFGSAPEPPPAPGPAPGQTGDVAGEFDSSDFFSSLIQTIKDVVTKPKEFFKAMPKNGGYGPLIIFGAVTAAVGAVIGGVLSLNPLSVIGGIFFGPIAFIIGSFIFGGIIHVTSLIFADGAKGGFEASWRAVAYPNAALAPVTSIPIIGQLIGLYGIYLAILGIQEVHSTTIGKAALAVLIPLAVFIVIGVILALIAWALFGALLLGGLGLEGLDNF